MNNPPISSSVMALLTYKSGVILVLKRPRKKKKKSPPNNELSPDKGLPLSALTTKLCCHPVIFADRQLIKNSRQRPLNDHSASTWAQVWAVPLSVFPHPPMAPIQITRLNALQTREWHTGAEMINVSD